ncbi:hypothetical protein [Bradyrhizobium sp. BR 1433]|uniref:hypothetical protein n=1 Tax=Bradyrhizobium sp. BR 1433 TaxID=3447967 RepID=UPI003EE609AD
MTQVNAVVKASIEGSARLARDGRDTVDPIPHSDDYVFGSGTGTGRVDIEFVDDRVLATATSENLDLSGVLVDAFGQTIAAANIKAIEISADPANTTNLTVGGAAANTFVGPFADPTDALVLKPGARAVLFDPAGWTVTAATGDLLKVANSAGASATYRIKLLGASA